MKDEKLIIVFEGAPYEVDILESILGTEGITCFKKDNYVGSIAPYMVSAGGVGSVKLLVPQSGVEAARPLVEEFLRNISE